MLFVFIYVYWCPTRFIYLMMFVVSFNSNTSGVTCGAGSANPPGTLVFTPDFSRIYFARCLIFCVMFCLSLFVLLSVFLLAYVLSVLIQFTASEHPFGNFILFLADADIFILFLKIYNLLIMENPPGSYRFGTWYVLSRLFSFNKYDQAIATMTNLCNINVN